MCMRVWVYVCVHERVLILLSVEASALIEDTMGQRFFTLCFCCCCSIDPSWVQGPVPFQWEFYIEKLLLLILWQKIMHCRKRKTMLYYFPLCNIVFYASLSIRCLAYVFIFHLDKHLGDCCIIQTTCSPKMFQILCNNTNYKILFLLCLWADLFNYL